MATEDAAMIDQRGLRASEEGTNTVRGNFLMPDVIIILFLAILIDILDFTASIGPIISLILGLPLLGWMVWKTGKIQSAQEQVQRVRRAPQERRAFRQRQQERVAARKAATRKAWRRGVLYFIGGLIPVLSIFVLWTWAVISTVRSK